MNTIIQGILLGLSVAAPVGPTNLEIIRRGLKDGWKSAVVFCAGILVAVVILFTAIFSGLSFVTKSSTLNTILLVAGSVVLFYLAYHAIKDYFKPQPMELSQKATVGKHFVSGIVLTLANPVALALWVGIVGGHLASNNDSALEGLLLCAGILLGEILFFIFLIGLIHKGRNHINQKYFRYISLGAGVIFLYFGLMFVRKLFLL